jgi:hypothetical protein
MSKAKKAHWKQGKNGNLRDVVFLVPWNESNGIPLDRNMWIDCNSEENARLIAAAPDLLEALIKYMDAIDMFDKASKDGINYHGAVGNRLATEEIASAAIAKATGKTQ